MRCPSDDAELVVTEREGVSIHSCPTCSGVWMKRGELDEIVSQSIAQLKPARADRRGNGEAIDWREDRLERDPYRTTEKSWRRRDKYTEDERPRKEKNRRGSRDMAEDMYDF